MKFRNPQYERNEESASALVERITQQILRDFKSSRPKPRNRVMGFTGNDRPKRTLLLEV